MAFLNSLWLKVPAFALSVGTFLHLLVAFGHSPVVIVQPVPTSTQQVATTTDTAKAANVTAKKAIPTKAASLPVQKLPPTTKPVVEPSSETTASTAPTSLDNPGVSVDASTVESVNAIARASLVNILCTTVAGGSYAPISGSGIIVDSRGIILTNAHVAQYLLLKDYPYANNVSCIVRMGSPAQPLYTADVMYLPKEWIDANASRLTATHPMGTGENDFAFLRITGTVSPSVQMPTNFPALSLTADTPLKGAPVLLAAYPAGLLDGETIQKNLYTTSAVSQVQEVYTFNGAQNVDLIALNGSVVSQTGSSGGALLGLGSQKLIGLITTETQGTTTNDRTLNAISIDYINRTLSFQGQGGIQGFLAADPATKAADYQTNIMPKEIEELTAVLKKLSN